jgi:hypothetical protein
MGSKRRPSLDLTDPKWFLDSLDLETSKARFVKTDRDCLSRQPFLDVRWERTRLASAELPASALRATSAVRPRLDFIWHTSLCCSTLVAAALDHPGVNLSLKEPRALVELADLKRHQHGLKRPGLARAVFALFARRFSEDERILIKPSNFANNLLPEATAMVDGRMLMVYSSCRNFLISILKEGERRRGYVRDVFTTLLADGHLQEDWPVERLLGLSDMEVAALAWHMQIADLHLAMQSLGKRAASLDGDRFLDDRRAGLEALDAFFGLGLGSRVIRATVNGDLFRRNIKSGDAGRVRRQAEVKQFESRMGSDLDRLVDWAARAFATTVNLPRSLI